jgi:hypothetical protein
MRTLGAFDFLNVAFLNIGNFFRKSESIPDDRPDPEFYTLPVDFIRRHHDKSSSWEKVRTRKLDIEMYKNDEGFEPIAQALGVDYPARIAMEAEPDPRAATNEVLAWSERKSSAK